MGIKNVSQLIKDAENRLKQIETERTKIVSELNILRRRQKSLHQINESESLSLQPSVSKTSPTDQKISLFSSLFKGREDVFACRWESPRSGKVGYQPACRNEWIHGICRKPEIQCGACGARDFIPLNENVIRDHLRGFKRHDAHASLSRREYVIGLYPLLPDNTCYFLAADFDKVTWREDVSVFVESCKKYGIPVVIERSRSGEGSHAWIFFSEPIPAVLARRLGSFLLTETLDKRPEVGFDSYDRFFPSQDFMPKGGFGSLIALPLQAIPREKGNAVFLDEDLVPHTDQWEFLSTIIHMSRNEVDKIVKIASQEGKIIGARIPVIEEPALKPWKMTSYKSGRQIPVTGPIPVKLKLILGNLIYVEKKGLSPSFRNRLIHLAAFQNPEFYKAQAMRLSTYGKPRVISCAEDYPGHIGLPRGCLEEIRGLCQSLGIEISQEDERTKGTSIDVKFQGTMRPDQKDSVVKLLAHDTGVLAAATAFGKTVVAAKVISERAVNTMILVHRRQLLDQWRNQLSVFLNIDPEKIGMIGAGKRKPGGFIDIAIIQSLSRKGKVDDIINNYAQLIVDECHHISANSFEQVLRQSKARYVMGLSATVTRKDGHHPIIFMQCGPVRYRVTARQGVEMHPFSHQVIFRETGFRMPQFFWEKEPKIHEIYEALIRDDTRNDQIFEDVMKSVVDEKRSPLLISERIVHVDLFAKKFSPLIKNVIVFRGSMGKK